MNDCVAFLPTGRFSQLRIYLFIYYLTYKALETLNSFHFLDLKLVVYASEAREIYVYLTFVFF